MVQENKQLKKTVKRLVAITFFAFSATASAQPVNLDFSTFLGGTGTEQIRDVAFDRDGNAYVTGGGDSSNFPAARVIKNGGTPEAGVSLYDIFVVKFSPAGQLLWSTVIGGPNYDRAYAIELDAQGNIYLAGRAGSGFPVTSGAFQTTFTGGSEASFYGNQDGVVLKLRPDGSSIVWASYFGSPTPHIIRDIAVDAGGNVFLAASNETGSSYPPAVQAAFQRSIFSTARGKTDAVLAKVSPDGSQLLWAAYFGGSGNDPGANSVRLDQSGNPVLLVPTQSADALTTPGALDRQMGGSGDFYLVKMRNDGTALIFATFLGGSEGEGMETHNLAIDSQGNPIIGGGSGSSDYPTTTGAYDRTYNGSGGPGTGEATNYPKDGVITKVSADGSRILFSTYLGGRFGEAVEGIDVDAAGNIYVSGGTYSDNFPTTANAAQRSWGGNLDGFVAKLSSDLSQLLYSSFHGGSTIDVFRALAVSPDGVVAAGGETNSTNFPLKNASQSSLRGGSDAILSRYSSPPVADIVPPATPTDVRVID